MYSYPNNVSAAALILDTDYPGWENNINIPVLDINDCTKCILGQLYSSYGLGLILLFDSRPNLLNIQDRVFGWQTDVNQWIAEINHRRTLNAYNNELTLLPSQNPVVAR